MNNPNQTEIQAKMKKPSTYEVDGRRFIVTPVFNENGHESFSELLLRLIKKEVAKVFAVMCGILSV